MKFIVTKSALTFILAIFGTYFITSTIYADTYIRPGSGRDDTQWQPFEGKLNDPPESYADLNNTYFGNALFMGYSSYNNLSYVGLPSREKSGRWNLVVLQKSSNGQKDGPRQDLVFPSKAATVDFCKALIKVVHGIVTDEMPATASVFASAWLERPKSVIAVGYQTDYQGELTPATKYAVCPNPWGEEQNFLFDDENDYTGIKASGVVYSERQYYKVICVNPETPPGNFWYLEGALGWTNGTHLYDRRGKLGKNPSREEFDEQIGNFYCGRPRHI
ncbi:MAG: hypothetical protein K0R08_412 [Solimicrobium sp.]|jgi:hypothetical protein|nr:hypothetical protein [Solimicrobium sp.]